MASASSFRALISLAMVVVIGTLVSENRGVSAQCEMAIPGLISQCSQYVRAEGPKAPPSQDCCNVVNDLDVPCLCKLVTPEVEKIVSMDKVVFVARSCGLTVQPGMKCGSYTVPPV